MTGKYRMCEKLAEVSEKSQECGAFIDWLREVKKLQLCTWGDNIDEEEGFFNTNETIQSLLEQYFEIDPDQLERERRHMLKTLQHHHLREEIDKENS